MLKNSSSYDALNIALGNLSTFTDHLAGVPRTIVTLADRTQVIVDFYNRPLFIRDSELRPAVAAVPGMRLKAEVRRHDIWPIDKPPHMDRESAWRIEKTLKAWGIH